MPRWHKPHCGYCFKEFYKAKDVQLHISNTLICQAARDQEQAHYWLSPSPKIQEENYADSDPSLVL